MKNPWKKLLSNVLLSAAARHASKSGKRRSASSADSSVSHGVEITEDDLRQQFIKQDGKCYWFGIDLDPMDIFKPRYPLALSVDRIDNEKVYRPDNIVITCRLANLGRGTCPMNIYKDVIDILKRGKAIAVGKDYFEIEAKDEV